MSGEILPPELIAAWVDNGMRTLAQLRKEYGDEFWAKMVGVDVVANIVFATHDGSDLGAKGRLSLDALGSSLEEIQADPILAQEFVVGMRSQMELFFKEQLNK